MVSAGVREIACGLYQHKTMYFAGGEGYNAPSIVCDIYFNGSHPCLGGLLVVDGLTGREMWRHYTPHEIFAVTCQQDLNMDGFPDCLIAGRVGVS